MSQKELDFGRSARVRFKSDEVRGVMRQIADTEGLKELAYAADVSPSYVTQALAGTKNLKIEIVEAALEIAQEDLRMRLLAAIAGHPVLVSRQLTPEEKVARLEARMRVKFGELGAEAIREAYSE